MRINGLKFLSLLAAAISFSTAANAKSSDPAIDGGATFTAGSDHYHRFAVYSDFDWHLRKVDPYAWAQFASSNYAGYFSFGGGVWKDLNSETRIKGGMSVAAGHIHDSGDSASSLSAEAAIEKDIGRPTVGAEYELTNGNIGSDQNYVNDQNVRGRFDNARSANPTAHLESYTYNEFSGYARFPVQRTNLGLRLTVGFPSYDKTIVDETLSWKFPLANKLSLKTAFTLEQQGFASRAYFSLGLLYYFR